MRCTLPLRGTIGDGERHSDSCFRPVSPRLGGPAPRGPLGRAPWGPVPFAPGPLVGPVGGVRAPPPSLALSGDAPPSWAFVGAPFLASKRESGKDLLGGRVPSHSHLPATRYARKCLASPKKMVIYISQIFEFSRQGGPKTKK